MRMGGLAGYLSSSTTFRLWGLAQVTRPRRDPVSPTIKEVTIHLAQVLSENGK